MADNTFVIHSDWLNAIDQLPLEDQDKIIAEFVRYGCRLEQRYSSDPRINSFTNLLKGRIDFSIKKHEGEVVRGRRKLKADDKSVYEMAREGMSADEIAEYFGVKKNTIQHKEGWKQRNNPNFV